MEAPLEARPIWSQILPLLATEPIPIVAARFQLSAGAIASAIKRSGFTRRAVVREALEENSLLHADPGARPDTHRPEAPASVPASTASPRSAPRPPSKVEAFHAIVGVESDSEVARRANVSRKTVREYRARHRIPRPAPGPVPAASQDTTNAPRRTGLRSPLDAVAHLIGVVPDREVARQAGVSRGALYQYRTRRGLPGYRGTPVPEPTSASRPLPAPAPVAQASAPAPEPAAPVASSVGAPARRQYAYTVIVRRDGGDAAYIVLGGDIGEACGRAMKVEGEIVAVTLHLEAIA